MPGNDVLRQRLHAAARVLNSHRLSFYALASLTAVGAVVVNALKNYSNFYSVAIYLSKSSRSVLALANFCFLIALLCGHLVQRIFFGPLRPIEIERLYDRLWFFITESLLAFTIFRDEFDVSFGFMFGFLLFVKSFHWLASDRIEWMDQRPYPGPPLLFHCRMVALFIVLWVTDIIMFMFTIEHTLNVGVGGMVLFASEYGILISSIMNTICKYLLTSYELRRAGQRGGENAPPWENKSMWTFYIELATDFMKLSVYLVFFTVIITFYGLPLNIVRDVYITARSFITRLRALHRYQTATRNMDQRYPNADEQELAAMSDRTCIICREEMVFQENQPQATPNDREGPNMTPKKLPCGHIFHFYCLRSWLERQQSCPTCRRTVLDDNPPTNPQVANNNPPAPAPGAIPQLNQQGNNPLGNPLGFVNRFFGPPNLPQNNNQNPQNQAPGDQTARPNGAAPAREIMVQYDVEYQGRRAGANHPGQVPTNLNPVPQYRGHRGPDGGWQAWPEPGQLNPTVNGAVNAAPAQSTPTTQPQNGGISTDSDNSDSDSESDTGSTPLETLSPREAARQAALRRFGGPSTVPQPTPTPTTTAIESTSQPVRQRSSPTPSSSASTTQTFNHGAPPLIPMYDIEFSANSRRLPALNWNLSTPTAFGAYPQTAGLFDQVPAGGQTTPLSTSRSLSSIPSHLSDEQLETLDQLTREAIDERLRVLEGVSNTVYRCIDDLMRMRSALPSSLPSTPNAGPSHPSSVSRKEEKRPEVPTNFSGTSEDDSSGDTGATSTEPL
ncbi:synoviolin 1 isoform b [Coprinopsis cinerea okayama7|uniref:RING-type E3 ubiquitin transferase n=1 Tax=Coprinopsis cinerea (strain Okayama-7 / 130 / ATCC MYA-4618 / FGSC 9003) TaxID=240176 RepID=A8N6L4_COPC7|nr:synoviolin 1 isoform b [Coprinopsis cinerea okayama7\|eukprot:XP_001830470.2 synoviolin 1 isoform b [Coprinopsis cinerea okayama7\